jgi:hypothetical protein
MSEFRLLSLLFFLETQRPPSFVVPQTNNLRSRSLSWLFRLRKGGEIFLASKLKFQRKIFKETDETYHLIFPVLMLLMVSSRNFAVTRVGFWLTTEHINAGAFLFRGYGKTKEVFSFNNTELKKKKRGQKNLSAFCGNTKIKEKPFQENENERLRGSF